MIWENLAKGVIDYNIILKKGNENSNLPISLSITGEKGETEKFHLVPPDSNTEDKFKMKDKDVGKVNIKLIISFRKKYLAIVSIIWNLKR